MQTIKKTKPKDTTITTKATSLEKQKLQTLAKNKGVTLSNLINQLIKIGYLEITKKNL